MALGISDSGRGARLIDRSAKFAMRAVGIVSRRAGETYDAADAFADGFLSGDERSRRPRAELARCVPPQNSMEYCRHFSLAGSLSSSETGAPTLTTRTMGGYFSPKTARRPLILRACSLRGFLGVDGEPPFDSLVDEGFNFAEFIVAQRFAVGEVEAEFFGIDEGAFLLDVVA